MAMTINVARNLRRQSSDSCFICNCREAGDCMAIYVDMRRDCVVLQRKTTTPSSYNAVTVFSFLLTAIISCRCACYVRHSALVVYNFRRRGLPAGVVDRCAGRAILTTLGMKSISFNCIGRNETIDNVDVG